MKKFLFLLMSLFLAITLVSCGEKKVVEKSQLRAPTLELTENVVSWQGNTKAKGYVVKVDGVEMPEQTETSYTINADEFGEYEVSVKAIAKDTNLYKDSGWSATLTYVKDDSLLPQTTLFLVGDSTVCSFTDKYYFPRYGYGTQVGNYLSSKVKINNLALSGRSSNSFIVEDNYSTLKADIKAGDYLMIGFGHNDEKDGDSRYASPTASTQTVGSFKYNLYEYYIKVALNAGATPILCTPVVRANDKNDYSGDSAHITKNGDYRQAIIDLGNEKNVTVVDLTTETKNLYTSLGYEEAICMHAIYKAKNVAPEGATPILEPNMDGVDKTHLNIFGAKMVAYFIANALKKSDCDLSKYVMGANVKPTKETCFIPNENYVYKPYSAPEAEDLAEYKNMIATTEGEDGNLAYTHYETISDGWYGTAFGNTGGNPLSSVNGFRAKEISAGVFEVGQYLIDSEGKINAKGKFSSSEDGFAIAFKQVSINDNFKISCDVEILQQPNTKQTAFGLMLRDDIILNQSTSDTISSNFVASGLLTNDIVKNTVTNTETGSMHALFSRSSEGLKKGASSSNKIESYYEVGDTAHCEIVRTGQVVNVTLVYKGVIYTETYTDFDFVAEDKDYMYVGMFATRGTVAKFTNVVYTYTGEAQGA